MLFVSQPRRRHNGDSGLEGNDPVSSTLSGRGFPRSGFGSVPSVRPAQEEAQAVLISLSISLLIYFSRRKERRQWGEQHELVPLSPRHGFQLQIHSHSFTLSLSFFFSCFFSTLSFHSYFLVIFLSLTGIYALFLFFFSSINLSLSISLFSSLYHSLILFLAFFVIPPCLSSVFLSLFVALFLSPSYWFHFPLVIPSLVLSHTRACTHFPPFAFSFHFLSHSHFRFFP